MQQSNYDRILGILCSVLDAYSAVLFLPVGESENAAPPSHYIAAAFTLGNKLDYNAEIVEGRGLVGWILRNKEPLLVSNFDGHTNSLGYYSDNEDASIKAFMGCALPDDRGIICVDSKRQYSFSEKDQKILHLFADLIARFEAENRVREEQLTLQQYYSALNTIYELRRKHTRWPEFLRHLLDLLAAVTGLGYCALFTRDPEGGTYSVEDENIALIKKKPGERPSFPLTHGVVGWVFRNNAPVSSDGPDSAPEAMLVGRGQDIPLFQSILARPLAVQHKTMGVLCLAHDLPLQIHESTEDFIQMVAEHLSLFLENLYLKSHLRELHKEVQAMRLGGHM